MAQVYKHEYLPVSVYGNVVALLQEHGSRHGVHLDIGCGYGAIAEPVSAFGLTYVGFDLAEDGLSDLAERGFETHRIDLADPQQCEKAIRAVLNGRPVASITFMDTLEHITNGRDVVAMLRRLADHDNALLVLSVPNVAHKDIALKLLAGRWDMTEAGLLDHTHVAFYTPDRIHKLFASTGWKEVGKKDWLLEHSDQEFPIDLPLLNPAIPIGRFLRQLIDTANPQGIVNQFVRAFRPAEPQAATLLHDRQEPKRPLLSIILLGSEATDGIALTLQELSTQSNFDFEVFICGVDAYRDKASRQVLDEALDLASRVVVATVEQGTGQQINETLAKASGHYVVFLRPEERLERSFVAGFAELAINAHGEVLATRRPLKTHNPSYLPMNADGMSLAALASLPHGSLGGFALPGGLFRHLGLRWEDGLGRSADVSLVVLSILICGVRIAKNGHAKETMEPAEAEASLPELGGWPVLFPGSMFGILKDAEERQKQLETARQEVDEHLRESQSQVERAKREHRRVVRHFLQRGEAEQTEQTFARLGQFLRAYAIGPGEISLAEEHQSRPFLSVVTRTLGNRAETFRDMLLSLAGQSDQDFELIVMVHSADRTDLDRTWNIVEEFPETLRRKVRVESCSRPGRAAPLNDGFALAKGRYIAALDDDDFVFGHWVETFRSLSEAVPGSILRATCARQDYELAQPDGNKGARASSWFEMQWPGHYDALAHFHTNYSPFMSLAFPSTIFNEQGLRFDETLSTTEDWDFTLRATMLSGVHSTATVTAVYRWWLRGESSMFVHTQNEWTANRQRVLDRLSTSPILLPAGAANQLATLISERYALIEQKVALKQMAEEGAAKLKQLASERDSWKAKSRLLEKRIEWFGKKVVDDRIPIFWSDKNPKLVRYAKAAARKLLNSRSWRVTSPLRKATNLMRGRRSSRVKIPSDFMSAHKLVVATVNATSWKVTAPLRLIAAFFAGKRRR